MKLMVIPRKMAQCANNFYQTKINSRNSYSQNRTGKYNSNSDFGTLLVPFLKAWVGVFLFEDYKVIV